MKYLKYMEEQTICRLFGISKGYAFEYWYGEKGHNKTKTRDLILDACGIDIFKDNEYKNLSQEKCIKRIWNEESPQQIADLLQNFLDYFSFMMGDDHWTFEDERDFNEITKIIERLRKIDLVELPIEKNNKNISIILEDIENNLKNEKPEMVVDRLHTYSCEYLRNCCKKHNINTLDNKGAQQPLHSLIGMLTKWYDDNQYFDSEFPKIAMKCSVSVFSKFNDIRNKNSAAHPNRLLSKAEAEYVVRIISDTLVFIDKIEKSHNFEIDFIDINDLPF